MNPPVNAPAIKIVKSVREQVSAEEWQSRVDLAASYRLTAMYGMTEMIANHISCRVPGSHDHFLINPYGMLYEEIDASCLIKIDVDGNELLILHGMQNLLTGPKPPRTLQIEINQRHKPELFALMQRVGYSFTLRHDTLSGQKAIAAGQDPEAIGYNAIFEKRAA